jgi:uncharacterized membrane-anchored protein
MCIVDFHAILHHVCLMMVEFGERNVKSEAVESEMEMIIILATPRATLFVPTTLNSRLSRILCAFVGMFQLNFRLKESFFTHMDACVFLTNRGK